MVAIILSALTVAYLAVDMVLIHASLAKKDIL
jgi:hypothetical protein